MHDHRVHRSKLTLILAHKYAKRPVIRSVFFESLKCEQVVTLVDMINIKLRIQQGSGIIVNFNEFQCAIAILVQCANQIDVWSLCVDHKRAFINGESDFIGPNLMKAPHGQFMYFPELAFLHLSFVNEPIY